MMNLMPMQVADLNEVMAIENKVYSHPWTRGNFIDSLAQSYNAWIVRSEDRVLLGYYVQMPVVDEMHLLTLAVKDVVQGQGIGQLLLRHMVEQARQMHMIAVSLEVRVSNRRALAVYEAFGFLLAGCRKNYYETFSLQREDALILRYVLAR